MVIPSVNPSERLPEGARARGRGRGTAAPAHPEIPLGAGLGGTRLPGHPGALPVPNPSPPTPRAASPARFVPNPAGSRQEFRSCSALEFRLFHVQARPELQMFRDGLGSCCPSCGPDIPERRPCPPRGAGIPGASGRTWFGIALFLLVCVFRCCALGNGGKNGIFRSEGGR